MGRWDKKAPKKDELTKKGGSALDRYAPGPVEKISTGVISLDIVLGGGYPKGNLIEVTSETGVGKTTMLLQVAKNLIKKGIKVAYNDLENGVEDSIIEGMGLKEYKDSGHFKLSSPRTFDELEEVFDELLVPNPPYPVVVIDSLTAAMPGKLEGISITEIQPGLQARLESALLQKYKSMLRKTGVTVFMICQMRTKFDFRGKSESDTAGSKAVSFYSDMRIRLKIGERMMRKEMTAFGERLVPYGNIAHIWSLKNRSERPDIMIDIPIIFGVGVSNIMTLKEVMSVNGMITGGGGGNFAIHFKGEDTSVRGTEALNAWIRDHRDDVYETLKTGGFLKLTRGEVS